MSARELLHKYLDECPLVAIIRGVTCRGCGLANRIRSIPATSWTASSSALKSQAGSSGAFGSIPLFWGTVFIGAIIAMIVAIPLGLMSAIFLSQYAPQRLRAWLKPILEILAGVPTVVYGYFAALTVAPHVRKSFAVKSGPMTPLM